MDKTWSFAGLFVIMLVVSMPFYTADALAQSVQVTRSSGEGEIDGFIDATGDVWIVDAVIRDAPIAVRTGDVKLRIGQNEQGFTSCGEDAFGTTCQYVSTLQDGVQEGTYRFEVAYNFVNNLGLQDRVTALGDVRADGSAPVISVAAFRQQGENLFLDFSVAEVASPSSGLGIISVLNAGSEVFRVDAAGAEEFHFVNDGGMLGILTGPFAAGEVEIVASDLLGHSVRERASTRTDFVAPELLSVNFSHIGKFLGEQQVFSQMDVRIRESNVLSRFDVTAFSNDAELNERVADECKLVDVDIWQCEWDSVLINPGASVTVEVTARDSFGNTGVASLSQSFTNDNSPPQIVEFRTENQFEGGNFVRDDVANGKNRIYLQITEEGAGIGPAGIVLDVSAFGAGVRGPDHFNQSTLEMYWDVGSPNGDGPVRVGFTKFEDNVGNIGEPQELAAIVDSTGPRVTELEFNGLSEVSKDYIQSNDKLRISFKALEKSGIIVLVGLRDFVDTAEKDYPRNKHGVNRGFGDGYRVYTEPSCVRDEDIEDGWVCEVITENFMSGTGLEEEIDIRIRDTAGNEATYTGAKFRNVERRGDMFRFRFLGLDNEEAPDHWRQGEVKLLRPFIDLDTVESFPTRMQAEVELKSDRSSLKALDIQIGECVASGNSTGPKLQRSLLVKRVTADGVRKPKPVVILEFEPFSKEDVVVREDTFKSAEFEFTCGLIVYSKIGEEALLNPEQQEIKINVPFQFSELGSTDENIAAKLEEVQDDWFFKSTAWVGPVNEIIKWLGLVTTLLSVITAVDGIITLASDGFSTTAGVSETTGRALCAGTLILCPVTGVTETIGAALRGTCFSVGASSGALQGFTAFLQPVATLLSCNPSVFEPGFDAADGSENEGGALSSSGLNWYFALQKVVLESYNVVTGRKALGMPATSLYENMFTSIFGLCIPGILFNIQKAREIRCRQIICLAQEVPSGIATMDMCDNIYDILMCEFVWGEVFELVPLVGLVGSIGQAIKRAFSSPLGLISLTEVVACLPLCFNPVPSPGLFSACKVATFGNKIIGLFNTIVGAIKSPPTITQTPFCDQAGELDLDGLAGEEEGEEEEPTPTET